MKAKNIIAILLIATAFSCKKENKNSTTSTPSTPTNPPPTVDIEFFVNANKYQIREPFDYPSGSPLFTDLTNTFSTIGTGDPCSVTGKKLTMKYSTSDTTDCEFWFFTAATPTDTYRGTCELKITPNGNILFVSGSIPSSTPPYLVTCKKAVVFQ